MLTLSTGFRNGHRTARQWNQTNSSTRHVRKILLFFFQQHEFVTCTQFVVAFSDPPPLTIAFSSIGVLSFGKIIKKKSRFFIFLCLVRCSKPAPTSCPYFSDASRTQQIRTAKAFATGCKLSSNVILQGEG